MTFLSSKKENVTEIAFTISLTYSGAIESFKDEYKFHKSNNLLQGLKWTNFCWKQSVDLKQINDKEKWNHFTEQKKKKWTAEQFLAQQRNPP